VIPIEAIETLAALILALLAWVRYADQPTARNLRVAVGRTLTAW
jgi:hypothetical protein